MPRIPAQPRRRSWRRPRAARSGQRRRRPFVKICGITDAEGVLAAIAVRPRCDRPEPGAGDAASSSASTKPPRWRESCVRRRRADCPRSLPSPPSRRASGTEMVAAIDPDAIQFSGREPVAPRRAPPVAGLEGPPRPGRGSGSSRCRRGSCHRGRACLRLPRAPRGSWSTRPAGRTQAVLADPPRPSWRLFARDPPVLSAGLRPGNVAAALREIPAVGVDVASGVERASRPPGAAAQGRVQGRAVREAGPRGPR